MPEPPAEHSERTGLVAEEARGVGGGDALDKEGAQRLVLALSGVGRFPKEARLVCKPVWCFSDVITLHDVSAHVKGARACSAVLAARGGRPTATGVQPL